MGGWVRNGAERMGCDEIAIDKCQNTHWTETKRRGGWDGFGTDRKGTESTGWGVRRSNRLRMDRNGAEKIGWEAIGWVRNETGGNRTEKRGLHWN
ncbi:unnamed protein product [Soboliphyme baturini]|uniref:Uncharacterized protein n=1 Tax=Soboliphyme baturini TaxID=241478 RepID=A0A183I966_9BILA|nr:unnamed protein product [Soboliphyme baturini]